MKQSKVLSVVATILILLGGLYFLKWLYHETNLLFVIGTVVFMVVVCLFQLKVLQLLEHDQCLKQKENRLEKDLKNNREKLFLQIQKLVKWQEMARQDFEDTLDYINGYSEEEIQKKYREKY